ncbi:MAG: molecular chaperone DnaJ [Bacteroidetes bacterium]|nr:molecular chaperone DnaJ [Bacteroidota bacterium]
MRPVLLTLALLLSFFSLAPLVATAQLNLGQTDRWMKGALSAMERSDYQSANSIFRNLIDSGLPLPEEMPYYFSETLFQLGQFDNSQNFVNKYLELTGFTGQNYDYAVLLKEKLKGPLAQIIACELCDRRGYRYTPCSLCGGNKQVEQACAYCRANGVVGCSRCGASGMIKKINVFNIIEFFECERCAGNGRLSCPTCDGSGKEVSACKTCEGSGKIASKTLCSHEKHVHTGIGNK